MSLIRETWARFISWLSLYRAATVKPLAHSLIRPDTTLQRPWKLPPVLPPSRDGQRFVSIALILRIGIAFHIHVIADGAAGIDTALVRCPFPIS